MENKTQFIAKAKFIRYSPYKLRPIADLVRGKDVSFALKQLSLYQNQRVVPVKKVIESATANAKNKSEIGAEDLFIKEIYIDQGPYFRYFKPSAMGRAKVQRKRLSHISVKLERKKTKEV